MSGTAKTIQASNAGVAMPLLKVLLTIAAIGFIGFWVATHDLPAGNYLWSAFEVVVAILLIPVVISNVKRLSGKR